MRCAHNSALVSWPSMRENILRWAEEVSGRPFRAEARLRVESLLAANSHSDALGRKMEDYNETSSIHARLCRSHIGRRKTSIGVYRRNDQGRIRRSPYNCSKTLASAPGQETQLRREEESVLFRHGRLDSAPGDKAYLPPTAMRLQDSDCSSGPKISNLQCDKSRSRTIHASDRLWVRNHP